MALDYEGTVEIPTKLAFEILDKLRLAPIYVLKDSHPEELGIEDFKPWKWTHEIEFANEAHEAHRQLLDSMKAQSDGNEQLPHTELGD